MAVNSNQLYLEDPDSWGNLLLNWFKAFIIVGMFWSEREETLKQTRIYLIRREFFLNTFDIIKLLSCIIFKRLHFKNFINLKLCKIRIPFINLNRFKKFYLLEIRYVSQAI